MKAEHADVLDVLQKEKLVLGVAPEVLYDRIVAVFLLILWTMLAVQCILINFFL